jgi:transposase
MLALIHVFLDNARYHHAKLVQDWFSRPDCRIKLHFIPSYCPHLNPIERLWGPHASKRHAQQNLRNLRPIRRCDARFPARKSTPQLGQIQRFGHRQFPRHQPKGFSGHDGNGYIITEREPICHSTRIVRSLASYSLPLRARLSPSRKWAVCIIAYERRAAQRSTRPQASSCVSS